MLERCMRLPRRCGEACAVGGDAVDGVGISWRRFEVGSICEAGVGSRVRSSTLRGPVETKREYHRVQQFLHHGNKMGLSALDGSRGRKS
jgi:hypothetical protein